MAQTLELLARRTGTMQSIRGIIRTMKTMSAINVMPYEQASVAIEAYRATVLDGFHAFLHQFGPIPTSPEPGAAPVIVAYGTDLGLCGNYNEVLASSVATVAENARVLCIGVQLEDALAGLGITPEVTLLPPATAEGLGRLAGDVIARLDTLRRASASGAVSVTLVYMQRAGHGSQAPALLPLLPLDPMLIGTLAARPWVSRSLPQFTLPPDDLLAALIRSYLFTDLFRAGAEALVTENAARLARMQQAEQSVDERLDDLTAETRTVRQSEITTELLDVITGFDALKAQARRWKKLRR